MPIDPKHPVPTGPEEHDGPVATETVGSRTGAPSALDRPLLLVAAVVTLGAVMAVLDVTVVNVSINAMAQQFDASLTTIQWVSSAYTLALSAVIPLTAWGSERFGVRKLFLLSLVMFTVGSLLAGLAWSATSIIAFRVVQGLGGGMLMPVGMMILTRAAGPDRLGRAMSVIGIPTVLGPIGGPVLGGWLVDSFSWRWIFFINLPIGLAALALAARVLPRDPAGTRSRLDLRGVLLLSPGLTLLVYGLARSGSGGVGEPAVYLPALGGALLLVLFVGHALTTRQPLIDLRVFRNKVFSGSLVTMLLMTCAVFGGLLLMPLYLQLARGQDATHAGLLLAPQGVGAMIAMIVSGRLADRTGVGRIAPVGLVLVAGSFGWTTTLAADTPFWQLGIALFCTGLGMGLTTMPLFTGAMQTMPPESVPTASTTLNITQQVGASVGTAVMTLLLSNALTDALGDGAAGGQPDGGDLGALGSVPPEALAALRPLLAAAFGDTFRWAVGFVAVAALVAVALLPRNRPRTPVGGEKDGALPPPGM
ncbi:DHA2 family efflux MFS transporter permease subunit [Streptomyces sp. NPDC059894]|uniref:DHA2 family efflux MFS transporter permease subunit n=1 Tax=unclassified Streptomyces TaxID=2593676 RepID=UPI003661264B